jgi:cytochrome c-type protein NapB
MKRKTQVALAALACALVAACATQTAAPPQSLRGAAPNASDPVFTPATYAGKKPGAQEGYTRTYSTQPPLIPHTLENFDEVTLGDNQCLECHDPANAKKKAAPPLSTKHLASAGTGGPAGSRYACTMCHVPQSDAPPLVENAFAGDRQVQPAKKQ